jgi:preprotein translocase SecE subunit
MSSSRVKGLGQFFKEVHGEFLKIIWPSRREFIGAVIIAVIIVCFFAVYLGTVDFCLNWLMKRVFSDVLGII